MLPPAKEWTELVSIFWEQCEIFVRVVRKKFAFKLKIFLETDRRSLHVFKWWYIDILLDALLIIRQKYWKSAEFMGEKILANLSKKITIFYGYRKRSFMLLLLKFVTTLVTNLRAGTQAETLNILKFFLGSSVHHLLPCLTTLNIPQFLSVSWKKC